MNEIFWIILAVIMCLMASSCATFKDHYSIGVKACSELCLKKSVVPCSIKNTDDYDFKCGGNSGKLTPLYSQDEKE